MLITYLLPEIIEYSNFDVYYQDKELFNQWWKNISVVSPQKKDNYWGNIKWIEYTSIWWSNIFSSNKIIINYPIPDEFIHFNKNYCSLNLMSWILSLDDYNVFEPFTEEQINLILQDKILTKIILEGINKYCINFQREESVFEDPTIEDKITHNQIDFDTESDAINFILEGVDEYKIFILTNVNKKWFTPNMLKMVYGLYVDIIS